MVPLSLAEIQLRRILGSPAGLAAGVLLACLCPVLSRLSPLGVVHASDPATELALRWSVPVGIAGALVGLGTLGGLEAFLRWLPPGPRARGEVAAVLTAVLAFEVPLFLGGALARGPIPPTWGSSSLLGGIAFALHLAVAAGLVARLPAGTALRMALFLVLVWIAPVLLSDGGGGRGWWAAAVLDPTFHLRSFAHWAEAPGPALAGLGPIVAMWGGSRLLLGPKASPR